MADYAFLKGPASGGFDPDKFKATALKGQGNPAKGKALQGFLDWMITTGEGEAASMAQKELTTEYAQDIDNVKEVRNNMTIAQSAPQPDSTMGDKIDDASITAQVKSSLLSHHSTSAIHTSVSTSNGVVTIGGVAKNEAEKALVTKLALDINGVTSVINNMTIALPVASN